MEGRLLSGSDDGLVCYWDLKGAGQTVESTQKFGEKIDPVVDGRWRNMVMGNVCHAVVSFCVCFGGAKEWPRIDEAEGVDATDVVGACFSSRGGDGTAGTLANGEGSTEWRSARMRLREAGRGEMRWGWL